MEASLPTTFLLIRHAQTIWNKEQRHTGSTEVPLSDASEKQIIRLTRRLSKEPIHAAYSSPLSRCRITIQPTVEFFKLNLEIDEALIERNLGAWEGMSPIDLLPLHPGYEFPKSAYDGAFHIPQAETLEMLEKRIRHFLNRVHDEHPGETVAVSTHSGVIWTVLHRIVSNPPTDFFWPSNCSITRIVSEGNHFHFESFLS